MSGLHLYGGWLLHENCFHRWLFYLITHDWQWQSGHSVNHAWKGIARIEYWNKVDVKMKKNFVLYDGGEFGFGNILNSTSRINQIASIGAYKA